MSNKKEGSVLVAALVISSVLFVVVGFILASSLKQRKTQSQAIKFNQKEAVLGAIFSRATADLQKQFCASPSNSLDSLLTGSTFTAAHPRVYGKAEFQLYLNASGGGVSNTFLSPETDPQVSIEPGIQSGASKIFKTNIKTQLCLEPVPGRTAPPPTTQNAGKGIPWRPACPAGKTEDASFVGFVDQSKFDQCPPTPPPTCIIRSSSAQATCVNDEKFMGGGCIGAMDGCYPGSGSNGQGASGPFMGVGTAVAICCSSVPGIDLTTQAPQARSFSPGDFGQFNCPAGFIALGAGAYITGGWDFSVVDNGFSGVNIQTRANGNARMDIHMACYKAPTDPSAIRRVTGSGSATCPVGTKLLAGRWSGFPTQRGAAYPSGETFFGPGTVTAICIKSTNPQPPFKCSVYTSLQGSQSPVTACKDRTKETLVGGGCFGNLDGCSPLPHPSFSPSPIVGWTAQSPLNKNTASGYAICCETMKGVDLTSRRIISNLDVNGGTATLTCNNDEFIAGTGGFNEDKHPIKCFPVLDGTNRSFTCTGINKMFATCFKKSSSLSLTWIKSNSTTKGIAICPDGSQILAGGWNCKTVEDSAYPIGGVFTSSCDEAYALCAR
jgi:hypothetical protein